MITLVVVISHAEFCRDGSIDCTLLTDAHGTRRFVANVFDPRLGEELPLFLNKRKWAKFVSENPGASSQVEWRLATRLFDGLHFSDYFDMEKVLKKDPHAFSKLHELPKSQKSRCLEQAFG